MKNILALLSITIMASICSVRGAEATPPSNLPLAALQSADDARIVAMKSGKRELLQAIFSDELRYAHSSGDIDSKTSFIEKLTSGKTKYSLMDYEKRDFTLPAPGIALMTGRLHIRVGSPENPTDMLLSFLAVWRLEKGEWRFLAWQSCKLPQR